MQTFEKAHTALQIEPPNCLGNIWARTRVQLQCPKEISVSD